MSFARSHREAGLAEPPHRIRLALLLDRPIYYILPAGKPGLGVYADTGRVLAAVDEATASRVPTGTTWTGRPRRCSAPWKTSISGP